MKVQLTSLSGSLHYPVYLPPLRATRLEHALLRAGTRVQGTPIPQALQPA